MKAVGVTPGASCSSSHVMMAVNAQWSVQLETLGCPWATELQNLSHALVRQSFLHHRNVVCKEDWQKILNLHILIHILFFAMGPYEVALLQTVIITDAVKLFTSSYLLIIYIGRYDFNL